jgi:hypothetical protein
MLMHLGNSRLRDIVVVMLAIAAAWQRPASVCAGQPWSDSRTTGPFFCQADFSLKPYDELFKELETLQHELVRVLGISPAKEQIRVYLFKDKASYRSFLRRQLPHVPYRRALYVKQDGPGMVFAFRHSELAVDLRHECTHALLHASLPMVPLWLDEGLAEYFEAPADERAFLNPHLASLRWNLRLGMMLSLEALEQKASLTEMNAQQYRFAWAWVHFMRHGPVEAHRQLVDYLSDIETSSPPGQLSARLRGQIPKLEIEIVRHFKTWRRPARGTASRAER